MFENLRKPFFVLAPMDDVTDTVFRQIVADCAKPDLFFTEFVNVDGLSDKEKPVIAQLWGLKPENYYEVTKQVRDMGFAGVDINMGCPVKTVTKNGACAALINNRGLAVNIIDAVKEAAGEDFPVSVKTRLGYADIDLSWPELLLSKKLNMLSIHGRTARELSKSPAHWDLIGEVAKLRTSLSPSTLLVGNGDVDNWQSGQMLAQRYGLDGIMIGRGIFHDLFAFAENSQWGEWTKEQKLELFKKHIELHLETYKTGLRKFETLRKFCKVYINGFEGAAELRAEFMNAASPKEALQLLLGG
jgi:tRNA-dihydrouridine synthase